MSACFKHGMKPPCQNPRVLVSDRTQFGSLLLMKDQLYQLPTSSTTEFANKGEVIILQPLARCIQPLPSERIVSSFPRLTASGRAVACRCLSIVSSPLARSPPPPLLPPPLSPPSSHPAIGQNCVWHCFLSPRTPRLSHTTG